MLLGALHHGERAVLVAGLVHRAGQLDGGAALVDDGAEDGERGAVGHVGVQGAVGRGDGVLAVQLDDELAVETCLVGIDVRRVNRAQRDGVDGVVAVHLGQLRAARHVDGAVHERHDGALALAGADEGVARAVHGGVHHGHGRHVGHERGGVLELGAAARHLGVLEVDGGEAVAAQALAVHGVLHDEGGGFVGHAVAGGNAVLKHLVAAPEVGAVHAARAERGGVDVVVGAVVQDVGEVLLAGVGHGIGHVDRRAEAAVHRARHGARRVGAAGGLAVDHEGAVLVVHLHHGARAPHGHGRADAVAVEGVARGGVVHQAVALGGRLGAVARGVGVGGAHDHVGRVVGVAGERHGEAGELHGGVHVVDEHGGVLLADERGGQLLGVLGEDGGVAVLGPEELRDVGGVGAHLLGPCLVGRGARLEEVLHRVEQADAGELVHRLVHGRDGLVAVRALKHLGHGVHLGLVGVVGGRHGLALVVLGGDGGKLAGCVLPGLVLHRPLGLQGVVQAHAGELARDLGARAEHGGVGVDVGEQVEAGVVARGAGVQGVGHLSVDAVPHAHLQRGAHGVGVGVVGEHGAGEVGGVHIALGEGHLVAHDLEQAVDGHGVLEAVHYLAELGVGVAGVGHAAGEEPVNGGRVVALDAVVGGGADHAVAADEDRAGRVGGVDGGGVVALGHVGGGVIDGHARAVGQGEGGVGLVLAVHHVHDGLVGVVAGEQVVGGVAFGVRALKREGAALHLGGDALGGLGLGGVEVGLELALEGGRREARLLARAIGAVALAAHRAAVDLALAGDEDVLLEGEHAREVERGAAAHATAGAAAVGSAASVRGAALGCVGQGAGGGQGAGCQRCANDERATGQLLHHVYPLGLERACMCAAPGPAPRPSVRICAAHVREASRTALDSTARPRPATSRHFGAKTTRLQRCGETMNMKSQ